MKTENVLNVIEKIATAEGEFTYIADEVLVALMHAYYYVKPEDTERFMFMLNDIVERGERSGLSTHKECDGEISLSDCNKCAIANLGGQLVKDCFNREYYTSQIKTADIEEEYNRNLLSKYVYQLDEEKLNDFLTAITALRNKGSDKYYFMSDANSEFLDFELWYIRENYDSLGCEAENPSNLVENLYLKRIAEALMDCINQHKIMAGHLAKMIYYYNNGMARRYLEFALYCEEKLDMNLFDAEEVTFQWFSF